MMSENGFLWSCVWQSTVCVLVGLSLSFALRRRPCRAHRVLFLAIVAAVVVPLMSAGVKRFGLGLLKPKSVLVIVQEEIEPVSNYDLIRPAPREVFEYSGGGQQEPVEVHEEAEAVIIQEPLLIPWREIFLWGWITASVVLICRVVFSMVFGVRVLGRGVPLECAEIERALVTAKKKLGIVKSVSIYCSEKLRSPVIWCWRREPVLLLPMGAGQEDAIDWVSVFCHELGHWKRWDHVSGLLAEVMVCVFPWNPFFWWAKRRLVGLSEQACDDWVVSCGQGSTDYADSLLGMASQRQMAFAPAVVSSKKGLGGRIRRILEDRCGNPRTGLRWALAITFATIICAGVLAFAQTRPGETEVAGSSVDDLPIVRTSRERRDGTEFYMSTKTKDGIRINSDAELSQLSFSIRGELKIGAGKEFYLPLITIPTDAQIVKEEHNKLKEATLKLLKISGEFVRPYYVRVDSKGPDEALVQVAFMFQGAEDPQRRIKLTVQLEDTGWRVHDTMVRQCRDQRRNAGSQLNYEELRFDVGFLDEIDQIEVKFEELARAKEGREFGDIEEAFELRRNIVKSREIESYPNEEFNVEGIVFDLSGGKLYAKLDFEWTLHSNILRTLKRHLMLELLDASGEVIGRTETFFSDEKGLIVNRKRATAEMYVSLGNWSEVKEAKRFLLKIKPAPKDAVVPEPQVSLCSIEVKIVDANGQAVEDDYGLDLWRRRSPGDEAANKWRKPNYTGQWYKSWERRGAIWSIKRFSKLEKLYPGEYIVTTGYRSRKIGKGRDRDPTPMGISDAVYLDGVEKKDAIAVVRLERGAPLTIKFIDSQTSEPVSQARQRLFRDNGRLVGKGEWADANGIIRYRYLKAGTYHLESRGKGAEISTRKEYVPLEEPVKVEVIKGQENEATIRLDPNELTEAQIKKRWPWSVYGTVTDKGGRPMAGVRVRVAAGRGRTVAQNFTDSEGKYRLRFSGGMSILNEKTGKWGVGVQAAVVGAFKDGYVEANQCSQGRLVMAEEPVDPNAMSKWWRKRGVVLPNEPYRVDFVMIAANSLKGRSETVEEEGTGNPKRLINDHQTMDAVELVPLKINMMPYMGHIDMIDHSQIPNLDKSYKPRPPFMVPRGTTNVALNKKVTTSAQRLLVGKLSMITDGIKNLRGRDGDLVIVELWPLGLQHVTIDLGFQYNLHAILIWHINRMNPVYYDVIVQVANDPEFKKGVVTLFNNDHDNSAGLGAGKDKNYVEMPKGKLIDANGNTARYVRLYSNGTSQHEFNRYVEVEVYGTTINTEISQSDAKRLRRKKHADQVAGQEVWGQVVNGLQLGLAFDGDDRAYRLGEVVSLTVSVRNVGDEEISWAYADLGHSAPAILGTSDKPIIFCGGLFTGSGSTITHRLSLQPGESKLLGKVRLQLGSTQKPKGIDWGIDLAPGQYRVWYPVTFGNYEDVDLTVRKLATGKLKLTVEETGFADSVEVDEQIGEIIGKFWQTIDSGDYEGLGKYTKGNWVVNYEKDKRWLSAWGKERKRQQSCGIDISKPEKVVVKGDEALALAPYKSEKWPTLWYYLNRDDGKWFIREIGNSSAGESVDQIFIKARQRSGVKFEEQGDWGEKVPKVDATQELVPSEYNGLVASIRNPGDKRLSDEPLRIEYTLTNMSDKAVVLYDLENNILPFFKGQWGCAGGGPSSEKPVIKLTSGQSVSHWVELTMYKGDKDWPFRINVRGEGTGFNQMFTSKTVSSALKFRVGYHGRMFTGKRGREFTQPLATPWIEIEVEKGDVGTGQEKAKAVRHDKSLDSLINSSLQITKNSVSERKAQMKLVELGDLAVPALLDRLPSTKIYPPDTRGFNDRRTLIEILSEIGTEKVLPFIDESTYSLGIWAAHCKERVYIWNSPDRLEQLVNALEKPYLRKWAIYKLGVLRDKKALVPLQKILDESDHLDTRESARDSIAHIKSEGKVALQYKFHRASQTFKIKTAKRIFELGEAIPLEYELIAGEYGSTQLLRFQKARGHLLPFGTPGPKRDSRYQLHVSKRGPRVKVRKEAKEEKAIVKFKLKAGESLKGEIDVSKAYLLNQPGEYRLCLRVGNYIMSNAVKIQIKPTQPQKKKDALLKPGVSSNVQVEGATSLPCIFRNVYDCAGGTVRNSKTGEAVSEGYRINNNNSSVAMRYLRTDANGRYCCC